MPTKVKICGITRLQDGLAAAEAGAAYLGFVFYPKSSRNLASEDARQIATEVRQQFSGVQFVGVMVNEPADAAARIVEAAELDYAQLHGSEGPDVMQALRQQGVKVIKALRFGPGSPSGDTWDQFEPDFFLCDTFDRVAVGGTGRGFDHSLIPAGFPLERTFLAGGLTPENVAAAVGAVAPYAVDVSTGVEAAPGRKDAVLVSRFIAEVKAANGEKKKNSGPDGR